MKVINLYSKKISTITIIIGILFTIIGIGTYLGIYLNTKDFRLIKNNYDFYANVDNVNLEKADFTYRYNTDSEYFTFNSDELTIDIAKLKENNPNFISSQYRIDLALWFKYAEGYDPYSRMLDLNLTFDNNITFYLGDAFLDKQLYKEICFGNDCSSMKISLNTKDGIASGEIDAAIFRFYSLKR